MTNITKQTKMTQRNKNRDVQPVAKFDGKKLLVLPLAILTLASFYFFLLNIQALGIVFTSSFYGVFMTPALPSLLVSVFSVLAMYLTFKQKPMGKIAIGGIWLFSITVTWSTLAWIESLGPDGRTCSGLFGMMESCSQNALFLAYVIFFNPFSLMLYSIFAIAGITTMAARLKK